MLVGSVTASGEMRTLRSRRKHLFEWEDQPWLSAFDVPAELGSFETMFAAFHHFMPEDAKRILADVAAKRRTVVVIEPFRRADFRLVAIGAFVRGIIHTPFVGPIVVDLSLPIRLGWRRVLPGGLRARGNALTCARGRACGLHLGRRQKSDPSFAGQTLHHLPDW
jgi:hypothetical protein